MNSFVQSDDISLLGMALLDQYVEQKKVLFDGIESKTFGSDV